MKLEEALGKALREFGISVLKEKRLIFTLSDCRAFDEYPAMKKVFETIVTAGYGKEIYTRASQGNDSECRLYADYLRKALPQTWHFRRDLSDYAADCISFVLGIQNSVTEPSYRGFDPAENGHSPEQKAPLHDSGSEDRNSGPRKAAGTGAPEQRSFHAVNGNDAGPESTVQGSCGVPSGRKSSWFRWAVSIIASAAAVTVIVLLVLNCSAFQYYRGEQLCSEQRYGAALEQFMKAADKGNTDALLKLGRMYESGTGVTQNLEKALKFYERANRLGSADAKMRYDSLRKYMEAPSSGVCAPLPPDASNEEMMAWNSMCL